MNILLCFKSFLESYMTLLINYSIGFIIYFISMICPSMIERI